MGGNVRERRYFEHVERHGTREIVTLTDYETGEIIHQFWRETKQRPTGRPPDRGRSPDFAKFYLRNWRDVVKKKKLATNEAGFFLFLVACFLDYESNFLVHPETGKNVSAREIAEYLDMDREHVREMLNRLHEKGVIAILSLGKGNPNHYVLNTNLVFRGQKIKNMAEHERFNDSPLELPLTVKYVERSKKEDG